MESHIVKEELMAINFTFAGSGSGSIDFDGIEGIGNYSEFAQDFLSDFGEDIVEVSAKVRYTDNLGEEWEDSLPLTL
jgi:hypothetical protein